MELPRPGKARSRVLPSPSIILRRQVARMRAGQYGLPPREDGWDGAKVLTGSDRTAVVFWLHAGLAPAEIAHATGLAVSRVLAFLSAGVDALHPAESGRVRSVCTDYWPTERTKRAALAA